MKNKLLSLILTMFIVMSSTLTSFANPIVAVPIAYEGLVALMCLGLKFGLELPKNDAEYWDYTRSLKKHLTKVDDEYIRLLEKTTQDWKFKNDKLPNDKKEPLQLPFIPGLSSLFDSVGKEVSQSYSYVSNVLNPIQYYNFNNPIDYSSVNFQNVTLEKGITYSYYDNEKKHHFIDIVPFNVQGSIKYTVDGSSYYSAGVPFSEFAQYSLVATQTGSLCILSRSQLQGNYTDVRSTHISVGITNIDISNKIVKPGIAYVPKVPSVNDDNTVTIPPLEVPSINIPDVDTVPGKLPGDVVVPPFEVSPPVTDPGVDPNPNPGTGLFPSLDSIREFIVGLVVPSDSFWTDSFNTIHNNFTSNFPLVDMGGFYDLVVGEKKFPNIDITIMGSKGRIVNGDTVNSIVDWLRPIIAGFMMLCLMFFNYRKIYKLIRNSEPFQGIAPGTSEFDTGLKNLINIKRGD